MGFQKHGSGDGRIIPDEESLAKEASRTGVWSDEDEAALQEENRQADA